MPAHLDAPAAPRFRTFFEAKAGPYTPHQPEELAPFAPREGAPEAALYLMRLRGLFADTDTLPRFAATA